MTVYDYRPDRDELPEVRLLQTQPHRFYVHDIEDEIQHLSAGLTPTGTLPTITRSTMIASIGSCFARHIGNWLDAYGYNFVRYAEGPCSEHGSTRSGRVYHSAALLQQIEQTFPYYAWEWREPDGARRILSPWRDCVAWPTHDDRKREQAEHERAIQRMRLEPDILIVTLGQNEVWYDVETGYAHPRVPPTPVYVAGRHQMHTLSIEQNIRHLQFVVDLLADHVHVIITVSPVPLIATFREQSAVMADCSQKAVLRVACEQFAAECPRATYFPAFELIRWVLPDPWAADQRHVTPRAIDRVMHMFERWFT